MKLWCLGWGATVVLLLAMPAFATTLLPPELIPLPFEPNSSELGSSAKAAVDRIAVRALSCPGSGPVTVSLNYQRGSDRGLLLQRKAAIEARFKALHLPLAVQLAPRLLRDGDRGDQQAANAPEELRKSINSGLSVGLDEYCDDSEIGASWGAKTKIGRLLDQLQQGISLVPHQPPNFWIVLTPEVRRDQLGLSLAQLAYRRWRSGDDSSALVFWWLVKNEAVHLPVDRKLSWPLHLWETGTDGDLAELQRLLAIPDLPLEERVWRMPQLVTSDLPWDVIERRLLAPGLMQLAGEQLPGQWFDRSRSWLAGAVFERREWASWSRLLDAAGPTRSCFVDDAMHLLRQSESMSASSHQEAMAALPTWAAGPAAPFTPPRSLPGYGICNPTGTLLRIATGCPDYSSPEPDLAARWLRAGFELDGWTLSQALSSNGWASDIHGSCRIEASPESPFPYRAKAQ